MKHLLLLVVVLFCSVSSVLADDSNLVTQQVTVNVSQAGTLGKVIGDRKPTNLKITGSLNIKDIEFVRDMAGCVHFIRVSNWYMKTYTTSGFLEHLDLKDVQLKDGESTAYCSLGPFDVLQGEEDACPVKMAITANGHGISGLFVALSELQSVVLPDSVEAIEGITFGTPGSYGGENLTTVTLPVGLKSIVFSNSSVTTIYAKMIYPVECHFLPNFDKSSCTVYVPKGSSRLYKMAKGWDAFYRIEEYDYFPAEELITRPFSVNVKQAGTLRSLIKDSVKYRLTDVKISGKLNIDDIEFIREMAGCDYGKDGPAYQGHLQYLNLKDVQFVGSDKIVGIYGEDLMILQEYAFDDLLYEAMSKGWDIEEFVNIVSKFGQFAKIDLDGKLYGLFSSLCNLKTIVLPDNLASIGLWMFGDCTNIASLSIPSSVTSIGDYAFGGCNGLTSLEIPYSVTSIGNGAFKDCRGLTSLKIPSGVTSIGNGAFQDCKGLTSLEIPSGVTSIGNGAFQDCNGLTSLEIPSSVTSIGDYAFSDCSGLTSLKIPSGVTSIGNGAFQDCNGLTSLEIPSGVTSIGDYAFSDCSGLTSLEIPSGVTSIGDYAFSDCRGLTSLEIPSSVTSIGNGAFRYCIGLTSLEIPSGVTSIGNEAFSGCSGLTSLEIPSGVTSIGDYAFRYCSGLTSLEIPSGVTSIGNGAFRYCSGLTSLEIPSGVTSIGNEAFSGCSGLTSLTIPSGVTSIGDKAFSNCRGLKYLSLPSSITSVGDDAFVECNNVTSFYSYMEDPAPVKKNAFYSMDRDKCTLYVPEGAFSNYIIATGWEYFNNIVEFDATGIDSVTTNSDAKEVSRYSVDGQKLDAPVKGLNIVKYSDGSIKKVIVK